MLIEQDRKESEVHIYYLWPEITTVLILVYFFSDIFLIKKKKRIFLQYCFLAPPPLFFFFVLSCLLSVQFSSVAESCPTLCDPMNRSAPGLPVHHQLWEFTQTD